MPPFYSSMKYVLWSFCLTVLTVSIASPQTTATTPKKKTTSASTKASTKKAAPNAVVTTSKNLPSKTVASTTAGASKTTVAAKTASAAKKGKTGRKTVAAAPARQMTPTAERYKEIQQALADKGYLKSEPTGVWDTDSSEALKQFQTDKNLTPTGKITAPSLIGLGLGPKTTAAGSDQPLPAPPAPTTPPPAVN